MSKVFIEESTLTAIGNAIRSKTGGTDLIAPLNMPTEINGISTGGGTTLPAEAYVFTGDCTQLFMNGKWKWYLDLYGSQVTTNNITNCSNMFACSRELTNIPFSINGKSDENYISCSGMFQTCDALLTLPTLTIKPYKMSSMFKEAKRIREIPESYATTIDFSRVNSYPSAMSYMFQDCYSLRTIPSDYLKQCHSTTTNTSSSFYRDAFSGCYVLNEIVEIPILEVTFTSNAFSTGVYNGTFWKCTRAKNIIFNTNEDGTAKTANWKNQTIDLMQLVGYNNISFKTVILNYNSGITTDKEVTDDTTYAALKDDPDWFTCKAAYSRYNKTSAIATINSLPDTSAYIAANGGTNTIKFTGASGSATDGGAINTMTEEEIAVATAKGWSVAYT